VIGYCEADIESGDYLGSVFMPERLLVQPKPGKRLRAVNAISRALLTNVDMIF
jgi:hypothetical protein